MRDWTTVRSGNAQDPEGRAVRINTEVRDGSGRSSGHKILLVHTVNDRQVPTRNSFRQNSVVTRLPRRGDFGLY